MCQNLVAHSKRTRTLSDPERDETYTRLIYKYSFTNSNAEVSDIATRFIAIEQSSFDCSSFSIFPQQ